MHRLWPVRGDQARLLAVAERLRSEIGPAPSILTRPRAQHVTDGESAHSINHGKIRGRGGQRAPGVP